MDNICCSAVHLCIVKRKTQKFVLKTFRTFDNFGHFYVGRALLSVAEPSYLTPADTVWSIFHTNFAAQTLWRDSLNLLCQQMSYNLKCFKTYFFLYLCHFVSTRRTGLTLL